MNAEQIPRIDRYTCRFENSVMEDQFLDQEWSRIKKGLNFGLIFISLVMLIDFYEAYQRMGGLKAIQIGFFVIIGLAILFITRTESYKSKYYSIYLTVLFCGIHTFMIIQGFLAGDSGQLNPIDALSSMPTVFMFVGILFPLNLVNTLICLSYLIITIIGLIPISELKVQLFMFSVPIPFILLVWNKYNTEYNNRLNFAKTVSIDQTKNLMQKTLKRYFGDVLSDKMLKEDGSISGENKWVTLSFTDISSYSTIIEHMSPKVAVEFLNEYFTAMHDVIEQHGGHILNYIGDCIMVVFGAPEEMDNHENQAIKCAMEMRGKLVEMNSRWDESELSRYWSNHGIEKITARTGIHTGSIIAGNIGSERMLQYSAIGDVVNVASRLEQANKEFGTNIAFSKEIYTALTKDLNSEAKSQGAISLKGREGETQVYSI